jgi:sulfite reductase beta subunit-like hemoprotein
MPRLAFLGLHVSETVDIAELSPLGRAHYYRRLAEDAARQARAASDETTRSAYQFLAEHWLKLAVVTEQTAGMQDVRLAAWETNKQDRSREER